MTSPNIGVSDGVKTPFDSYVGHEFEIREMPVAGKGECDNENNVCHSATFIVPESEEPCESFMRCYRYDIVHSHSLDLKQSQVATRSVI